MNNSRGASVYSARRPGMPNRKFSPNPPMILDGLVPGVAKNVLRMQLEVLVQAMKTKFHKPRWAVLAAGLLMSVGAARSQDNGKIPSSYAPVDIHESFSTILSRMTAAKPEIMRRHMALLEQRYDLSNRPAQGVKMSGGKAVQQGVRVKLASGTSWDQLSKLSPEQIKERSLYPAGFLPLPHPN